MFTGIVDHTGEIVDLKSATQSCQLIIKCQFNDLKIGESVAVNGVCLTVIYAETGKFTADISPETLMLTNLKELKPGAIVNLERPLKLADYINGHLVTGHVDHVIRLLHKGTIDDYLQLKLSMPEKMFVIPKGSIALNGVSLTINEVGKDHFEVLLIPETLRRTNLDDLKVGDPVNVEYDMIVKTISHQTSLFLSRHANDK